MNIRKPDLDDRTYQVINLPNSLTVLLISDPNTDKAAAALDVHVGHLCDPEAVPGLAHFCEHLLFMGSKKYPIENEYSQYLSQHNGNSNAYTSTENTNYYFDVASDALHGALDRFSRFFIDPLFDASCVDRELNAVDSEHKKNLQHDSRRIYQLEKDTCHPSHPYKKFGTGNLHTLKHEPEKKGLDIRAVLLDFYNSFYSANIMKLVILGKEPIHVLQEWSQMFALIANKNIPVPSFPGHPLTEEELGKMIIVKPLKDTHQMTLTFATRDFSKDYKAHPEKYWAHLLGHESHGSILSHLKSKGWAHELGAGSSGGGIGFEFFKISIELTEQGLEAYQQVICTVFEYLRMIKEQGIQEWIYKETQTLKELEFRFKEKTRPADYVSNLASRCHEYEPQDVLTGPYLLQEFSPNLIQEYLDALNPSNFRLTLVTSVFPLVSQWKKAQHYGTEYSILDFSSDLQQKLQNISTNSNLFLPLVNVYLPDNLQVRKHTVEPVLHPHVIQDNPLIRFWYKKDDVFWVPKAYCWVLIRAPMAYTSPRNAVLTKLYCDLVEDALSAESYYAECAKLYFSLDTTVDGLLVDVSGFNDKLPLLLQKILDAFLNLQLATAENRFLIIKEKLQQNYKNFDLDSPYQHAVYYMNLVLQDVLWTPQEKLNALKHISCQELLDFSKILLKSVFVEGLVHGNLELNEAQAICKSIETVFDSANPLPVALRASSNRTHILPNAHSCVFVKRVVNTQNLNSAIEFYLQIGDSCDRILSSKASLFNQMTNEAIFDQLRTKEQLGYIVSSGLRKTSGMIGFRILIQSEQEPQVLDTRIESYLSSLNQTLKGMRLETFENHKKALLNRLLEKQKSLEQASNRTWNHIDSLTYDFELHLVTAEIVKDLTLQDIQDFYEFYIQSSAKSRRKFVVYMVSSQHEMLKQYSNERHVVIDDEDRLIRFKSGLELGKGMVSVKHVSAFYHLNSHL